METSPSRANFPTLYLLAVVLGGVCLTLGAITAVLRQSLFDPESFGRRMEQSLSDPRVASYAADALTRAALARDPDLIAARPLILATAQGIVTSRSFRALAGSAARRIHQAVFAEGTRRVVLSLPDVEILLRSALAQASPQLAAKIPKRLDTALASLGQGGGSEYIISLLTLGSRVRWASLLFLLLAPGFFLLAIWLAPDRQQGLLRVGLAPLDHHFINTLTYYRCDFRLRSDGRRSTWQARQRGHGG